MGTRSKRVYWKWGPPFCAPCTLAKTTTGVMLPAASACGRYCSKLFTNTFSLQFSLPFLYMLKLSKLATDCSSSVNRTYRLTVNHLLLLFHQPKRWLIRLGREYRRGYERLFREDKASSSAKMQTRNKTKRVLRFICKRKQSRAQLILKLQLSALPLMTPSFGFVWRTIIAVCQPRVTEFLKNRVRFALHFKIAGTAICFLLV